VIFVYDVEDICEHLLEKIGSILVARSSGTRLWTGGIAAGQNWQAEWMEFLWTIGDENERRMLERRKFFWITLFANVSQLKWIILKEPFEDRNI
jgi:hypothetical protein